MVNGGGFGFDGIGEGLGYRIALVARDLDHWFCVFRKSDSAVCLF
jgi:hypothetical protein